MVIENETQLRKRVEEQEGKLAIKDSRSFFFFDAKVNGKRVKTMAWYGKRIAKEEALFSIQTKKNDKIEEFTLN